ncbi:MAG TPA: hypothetical protein VF659_15850 [Pyrinomonadaceae bacterium]|jgi:hypothetical protein
MRIVEGRAKTAAALFLLLSLSAAPAVARQQPEAPAARKVDSFGEIEWSDLMARLDNFAIELQNDPSARGLLVAYPARHKFPGWPLRRVNSAVDYLVSTRGMEASRLSAVVGAAGAETNFELWVVPPGAESPVKPFDASLLMSGEKTALPFDRFVVVERGDAVMSGYSLEPYPDSAGAYQFFAEVLRSDPGLRGCVIGYTWRRGSRAADRRIAGRAKLTIAKAHAIDVGRVVAFGGGRRQYKMIELWLVPPGAALPKPTPDRRPVRRKRRRHPPPRF